ncbi:MAG: hypothetical protein COA99_13415 [Moraxellaceae bacterium]|nr:MAG: hypothetical protein COA99_13415 [Moraxellaceae bacterium]
MNAIKLIVLFSMALLSLSAQAYNVEGMLTYSDKTFKWDGISNKYETKNTGLGAVYFFQDVDISKGPWAEASFLNKSSGVVVMYQDHEYKKTDSDFKYSSEVAGAAVHSVIESKWVLEAELVYLNGKFNDGDRFTANSKSVTIGSYIGERDQVLFEYAQLDLDYSDDLNIDHIVKRFSIKYRYLLGFGNSRYLAVQSSFTKSNSTDDLDTRGNSFVLGAMYYLRKNLGLRTEVELEREEDDNNDKTRQETYTLGVEYFPTESVLLNANYITENRLEEPFASADRDGEGTRIELNIGYRF